jgi:trans-aconitate methyltransferase
VKRAEFDEFAGDYQQILNRALAISGEDGVYFARERVQILRSIFDALNFHAATIMDFGCGTGIGLEFLRDLLEPEQILGVDVSAASLQVAAERYRESSVGFYQMEDYEPAGEVDLVFSNGVMHHIDPGERSRVFSLIHDALRPGGVLAIWENNPWSLPARYCMKANPFDRHAQMVSPKCAGQLCADAGLDVLSTQYAFVFPRWLSYLRVLEKHLSPWPLGAQYLVLSQRPLNLDSPPV